MFFCVVQTRKTKNALPSLTVVPSTWVEDKSVFWPPRNLVALSKDVDSEPDKQTWKQQQCKVVGRLPTYEQAEEVIGMLDKITDSEDALQTERGTRSKPGKRKPKFESKSYKLAPAVAQPVGDVYAAGVDPPVPQRKLAPMAAESVADIYAAGPSRNVFTVPPNSQPRKPAPAPDKHDGDIYPAGPSRNVLAGSPTFHPRSQHKHSPAAAKPLRDIYAAGPSRNVVTNPSASQPRSHHKSAPAAAEPVGDIYATGPSGNVLTDTLAAQREPAPTSLDDQASLQIKQPFDLDSAPMTILLDTLSGTRNPVMHENIQPTVADPTVLHVAAAPNPVSQHNNPNIVENTTEKVAMQTLQVFLGDDGKHYARLGNGSYVEILSNPDSTNDGDQQDLPEQQLNSDVLNLLTTELRKINDRLDAMEGILSMMTGFMANFEKLMQMRNKHNTIPTACQQNEDFSEFEGLPKIDSDESLNTLEQNLANPTYADKYFRYFHTVYSLNGKRESAPFFRTIIRKLTTPIVFLPYSWKGNKRSKQNSSSDAVSHKSFKECFPNLIEFLFRLGHAADMSLTREENEKLFQDYLRYKNTELKRFNDGHGEQRASSSRKRKQPRVELQDTSSKRRRSGSSSDRSETEQRSTEPEDANAAYAAYADADVATYADAEDAE